MAQSGSRAIRGLLAGKSLQACANPTLRSTAPWGVEHFYAAMQLISSPHATHFVMLGASGWEVKVCRGGGEAVRQVGITKKEKWKDGPGLGNL